MSANFVPRNLPQSSDPSPGPEIDSFKKATRLFLEEDSAVDAHAPGQFSLATWAPVLVLMAITAAYVLFEGYWNVSFLRAMSDKATSGQELDWMISEGRWLAAFGISWALLKGTFMRKADSVGSAVAAAFLVVGATVLGYAGIGRLYDAAIDALPAKQSLQMYKTAVHRTWAVGGELAKADVSAGDPVAVALWPLKVADAKQASAIEGVFEERSKDAAKKAEELAHKEWPAVKSKLASGTDPGEARKEFETLYVEYKFLSGKTRSVFNGWQQRRESEMEAFAGLRPDAAATPEDFAKQLSASRIKRHRELGKLFLETKGGTIDPVVYTYGAMQLRGSDFKNITTEEQFVALVVAKATNSLVSNVPTEDGIKARSDAHDVIAAAMVPPMAMALSCIGVLLNVGALLGLLCLRAPVLRLIPQPAIPLAFLAAVLALTPATTSLAGMEGGLAWLRENHGALSWVLERVITLEHWALMATA